MAARGDNDAITVAFAGGGTAGHINPNVGIAEALLERRPNARPFFVVSERPGDAKAMDGLPHPWLASAARPLPTLSKPITAVQFATGWTKAGVQTARLLRREGVAAVVATGGFVSGPVVMAARMLGIPAVMVNLDGVPGAANRALVRLCRKVFSAYASELLPGAEVVGLPLRQIAIGREPAESARRALGLDPQRRVVFVTGATHGAESIIRAMMALVAQSSELVEALQGWQILHQCGSFEVATLQRAYDDAGVSAVVVDFLVGMGQAFAAADLVLSRSGANSTAEAWANARPTVFMPNPYHADQHQRLNAQPMVDAGGAIMITDHIEPADNVAILGPALVELLRDDARREQMRRAAQASRPPDGAAAVADWLDAHLG